MRVNSPGDPELASDDAASKGLVPPPPAPPAGAGIDDGGLDAPKGLPADGPPGGGGIGGPAPQLPGGASAARAAALGLVLLLPEPSIAAAHFFASF